MKRAPRFSMCKLNTMLNSVEYRRRKKRLLSTPEMVTLGAHGPCNARCVFCPKGEYPLFSFEAYKNFFETRMGQFISNARQVTFTGFGELLLIPHIEDFLDHINRTLPEAEKTLTTNGTPLTPGVIEKLLKGRYLIQISLHASNPSLHRELTGLIDAFKEIIANIRRLADIRNEHARENDLRIELLSVLTVKNIDDLPDFLRLAWELRARRVRCSYMEIFSPDHLPLSCFFDQERTNLSLKRARAVERALRSRDSFRPFEAVLPPLFGERLTRRKFVCFRPWQHIYVDLKGSVLPCCCWGEQISDLHGEDIACVWNSRFYQNLRKGLTGGNPHTWCRKCATYAGYNVNDISCHITNRPDMREMVIKELKARNEPAMG
ncbi:MAG: radical SAM/SPASM domain-containing protein [bacterium]